MYFEPQGRTDLAKMAVMCVATFVPIAFLAFIDQNSVGPYLIPSFGATAVLVFAVPQAQFSRVKNVFFGHLFCAVCGISVTIVFSYFGSLDGHMWIAAGMAVTLAIVAMYLTGTIHPPGGATALACVLGGYDSFVYLVRPVMLGIVLLILTGYVADRVLKRLSES